MLFYSSAIHLQEEIDEDWAVAMVWPAVFQSEHPEESISISIKESFDEVKEHDFNEENTNKNKIDISSITQVNEVKIFICNSKVNYKI